MRSCCMQYETAWSNRSPPLGEKGRRARRRNCCVSCGSSNPTYGYGLLCTNCGPHDMRFTIVVEAEPTSRTSSVDTMPPCSTCLTIQLIASTQAVWSESRCRTHCGVSSCSLAYAHGPLEKMSARKMRPTGTSGSCAASAWNSTDVARSCALHSFPPGQRVLL